VLRINVSTADKMKIRLHHKIKYLHHSVLMKIWNLWLNG